jgi:8-oxo-dGTP pyrophosphatase MutT (NUDIX family)
VEFNQFKNKIATLKVQKLGGLNVQFELAPSLRLKYDAAKIKASSPRKAAVLVLLYPDEKENTTFILIERASYKGTHSAQISFPGGKSDKTDCNLQETALREAFEEVGVVVNSTGIIRELTAVYIPPSNFLATPYMAFVDKKPSFISNYEVANTIEVLVEDLLNESSLTSVNLTTSYMENTDVPCFKLNGYIVWGATAMILSEIKELLKH